ncbi:hypothetical protein LMG27174_01032 [Paraburkholderia rhynchosiae]|uniref:Uncharacterized protein n=1 Tax=Paraburkholderia rhynchosiae TaxID=487049 RepID=A0A6J5A0E6_9BURK|nr:hypothetical protein LMG27174_01032 [Paraburkholderia rhynchosiae]
MSPYIPEFIGTALMVLLGDGAVANVLLARTKGTSAADAHPPRAQWNSRKARARRRSPQSTYHGAFTRRA